MPKITAAVVNKVEYISFVNLDKKKKLNFLLNFNMH